MHGMFSHCWYIFFSLLFLFLVTGHDYRTIFVCCHLLFYRRFETNILCIFNNGYCGCPGDECGYSVWLFLFNGLQLCTIGHGILGAGWLYIHDNIWYLYTNQVNKKQIVILLFSFCIVSRKVCCAYFMFCTMLKFKYICILYKCVYLCCKPFNFMIFV